MNPRRTLEEVLAQAHEEDVWRPGIIKIASADRDMKSTPGLIHRDGLVQAYNFWNRVNGWGCDSNGDFEIRKRFPLLLVCAVTQHYLGAVLCRFQSLAEITPFVGDYAQLISNLDNGVISSPQYREQLVNICLCSGSVSKNMIDDGIIPPDLDAITEPGIPVMENH